MNALTRALVRDRTGRADAAREMAAVYAWTLGQGTRPACVHLG